MIIHPYSDTQAFAVGGKWEPIAAKFPNLAHFFKCNEPTHASVITLVDSITGLTVTGSGSLTNNGDGSLTLGAAATAISVAAIASPATKNVVLLTVGKPSAASSNIRLGAVTSNATRGFTNPSTGVAANAVGDGGAAVVATSADTLAGTAGANWQAKATIVQWNSATGLRHVGYDNTTGIWTTAATPGNTTGHTGITTINQEINIGQGSRPACIQVWYFTTLPSDNDIKAACTWTLANIIADPTRKWAYPAWAS